MTRLTLFQPTNKPKSKNCKANYSDKQRKKYQSTQSFKSWKGINKNWWNKTKIDRDWHRHFQWKISHKTTESLKSKASYKQKGRDTSQCRKNTKSKCNIWWNQRTISKIRLRRWSGSWKNKPKNIRFWASSIGISMNRWYNTISRSFNFKSVWWSYNKKSKNCRTKLET